MLNSVAVCIEVVFFLVALGFARGCIALNVFFESRGSRGEPAKK